MMGISGAGSVNLGSNSGGFNPAAMMTGMALGSAVGQNVAGMMNNMIGGVNKGTQAGTVPPPIPSVTYHIVINGQAAGPYDINSLAQMAASGQFTSDSLVWKAGMAQWANEVYPMFHIPKAVLNLHIHGLYERDDLLIFGYRALKNVYTESWAYLDDNSYDYYID